MNTNNCPLSSLNSLPYLRKVFVNGFSVLCCWFCHWNLRLDSIGFSTRHLVIKHQYFGLPASFSSKRNIVYAFFVEIWTILAGDELWKSNYHIISLSIDIQSNFVHVVEKYKLFVLKNHTSCYLLFLILPNIVGRYMTGT